MRLERSREVDSDEQRNGDDDDEGELGLRGKDPTQDSYLAELVEPQGIGQDSGRSVGDRQWHTQQHDDDGRPATRAEDERSRRRTLWFRDGRGRFRDGRRKIRAKEPRLLGRWLRGAYRRRQGEVALEGIPSASTTRAGTPGAGGVRQDVRAPRETRRHPLRLVTQRYRLPQGSFLPPRSPLRSRARTV